MPPKKKTTAPRAHRKRVTSEDEPKRVEFARLVSEARSSLHALCVRQPEFVATGFADEVFMAASIASNVIDLLAGDEAAAPHVLTRVRRMHAALEAFSIHTLEDEIRAAVGNQRTAKSATTRTAMIGTFLRRIGPHLEALQVRVHRIETHVADVTKILERWRASPNARLGQLGTAGVIVALLVLAGEDEDRARKRVTRATRD